MHCNLRFPFHIPQFSQHISTKETFKRGHYDNIKLQIYCFFNRRIDILLFSSPVSHWNFKSKHPQALCKCLFSLLDYFWNYLIFYTSAILCIRISFRFNLHYAEHEIFPQCMQKHHLLHFIFFFRKYHRIYCSVQYCFYLLHSSAHFSFQWLFLYGFSVHMPLFIIAYFFSNISIQR